MPKPVPAVVVLALLTRVRAARIASGEISAARLYDVRAFKCALAELGYLRTLTRRPTGGTIVTAMTQLRRWGADGVILGDQPEWQAARTAVAELMERYAAGRR